MPDDREAISEALSTCRAFSDVEIDCALSMIDEGFRGDYSLLGVANGGKALGYACFGKATLTRSAWYLYWMCVHPASQSSGLGRALQAGVEDHVRRAGGDRVIVETSGRPEYLRTRRFYEHVGFVEVGRIPDFYQPGDDCVVYCKVLGGIE
jgi:ribosomal protein S18 acetylase RimI-like enzyme